MPSPRLIVDVLRAFGPGWVLARGLHQAKLRAGHFSRRLPLCSWQEACGHGVFGDSTLEAPVVYQAHRLAQAPRFFFDPAQVAELGRRCRAWDQAPDQVARRAQAVAAGRLRFFGGPELATGFPPQWHRNHQIGVDAPAGSHWSRIGDFGHGDIKLIWEPSRFHFTYDLVRAHARAGGEGPYAELFWRAVEDWLAANPPQAGVNWKCGQEISFRLMAWCFGLHAFLRHPATTAERLHTLAQALHCFGRRIQANLAYALNQQNNHGVSEAAGLWTIGALFPELKQADQWRRLGARLLEDLARRLVYADGGFAQLSPTYHRLVQELYTWVLGLARVNGLAFSAGLRERLGAMLNWSHQLLEPANGEMPKSGGHDSSLLLPLSSCDGNDHRPALQALGYLLHGELAFGEGPWDETALWLCGAEALAAPRRTHERRDFHGGPGGFHVLRNPDSWAALRCGAYHHRPAHADLLHLDLWWRGRNLALDPGSFSYNAPGAWAGGLAETAYHNTVGVDGQDQMARAQRFMWLPWARSALLGAGRSAGGRLAWLEGAHWGYARLPGGPRHRRTVLCLDGQWWLVVDTLTGLGDHRYRLHWLLDHAPHAWDQAARSLVLGYPEGEFQVVAGTSEPAAVADLLSADPASPRGWCSPRYQQRRPALSLALAAVGRNLVFWTALGPAGFGLARLVDGFQLDCATFQARIRLLPGADDDQPSRGSLGLSGGGEDHLDLP